MGLPGVYLTNAAVTAAVGVGIVVWWIAIRRRIAAETIERANSEADRITRQAERDAESLKKEVLLWRVRKRTSSHPKPSVRPGSGCRRSAASSSARRQDAFAGRPAGGVRPTRAGSARPRKGHSPAGTVGRRSLPTFRPAPRGATARAPAGRVLDRRGSPRAAIETDRGGRAAGRRQPRQAARDRGAETAGARAQQIICDAIQRSAAEHAIETTVSVVDLPATT